MARRRRRKSLATDSRWLVFVGAALLTLAFFHDHPWLLFIIAFALGSAAYWRWWERPRRKRASLEQIERAVAEERDAEGRNRRERSQTIGGLLSLTAREFERRVGEVLEEHGYSDVEHVGKAGDLGIDLFATDSSGERLGIQCKRYGPDKLVGAPEVRLLYGDMTHAKVRGMFVTTSGFTTDASAYADSHGIRLIDGERLAKLVAALEPDYASKRVP